MMKPTVLGSLALTVFAVLLTGRSNVPADPPEATTSPTTPEAVEWTISILVDEEFPGTATAREALEVWAVAPNLAGAYWHETTVSANEVRFQSEGHWAQATRLSTGWFVLEAGSGTFSRG